MPCLIVRGPLAIGRVMVVNQSVGAIPIETNQEDIFQRLPHTMPVARVGK